jgi:hypothetical protein
MSISNFTLTWSDNIRIFQVMKWNAVIILFAILIGVVVPPSLPLITAAGVQASLGELDVCHSAAPALSSNGEMPCVPINTSKLPIYLSITASDSFHPVITEVVFTAPNEHPPKA